MLNTISDPSNMDTLPSGLIQHTAARLRFANQYRKSSTSERSQMIAFPERKIRLERELAQSENLGETPDGKSIFLFEYFQNSAVIRELGRLRELAFRAVGEGTGKLRDIDSYDQNYKHIVLWDPACSEIVGAYRIGQAHTLSPQECRNELYTNELFKYEDSFDEIFSQGIELGRSFIQPKYWSKRGLDYLWQGIGAYLVKHPNVRYLFGAVSISNDYPSLAIQQIVGHYKYYYSTAGIREHAHAKNPFQIDRGAYESRRNLSREQSNQELKVSLSRQGVTLPVLYKHYVELCEEQGVHFIDFNVDPDFAFCIDGLILVDLNHIKLAKRRRYLSA